MCLIFSPRWPRPVKASSSRKRAPCSSRTHRVTSLAPSGPAAGPATRTRPSASTASRRRAWWRAEPGTQVVTSKLVSGLRSVSLNVPDVAKAEEFYTRVWHLDIVARSDDAIYLRGTGSAHHLLSFHRGERTEIREITLRARTADALIAIADAAL